MRQITYQCDKCGKSYDLYESRSGFVGVQAFRRNKVEDDKTPRFSYGYRKYLCPECMAEIESWMYPDDAED